MDLYKRLKITKDASWEEIKKAYRKMIMEHHPDHGGNAQAFTDLCIAHTVLSDPEKRRQYDKTGTYDQTKGNIETKAMVEVLNLFNSIIESNSLDMLDNINIITFMKEKINERLKAITARVKQTNNDKAKIKAIKKRIKCKQKAQKIKINNLLDSKIKGYENVLHAFSMQTKTMNKALEIVDDFNDTHIIRPPSIFDTGFDIKAIFNVEAT